MIGVHDYADAKGLETLLKRSKSWVEAVNSGIDLYANDQNPASDTEEQQLDQIAEAAAEVLEACCNQRFVLDFKGMMRPSGKRYTFELAASALAQDEANVVDTIPEGLLDALPPGINDQQQKEYFARYQWMQKLEPMYQVIGFLMNIALEIRKKLNEFQSAPSGHDWLPLLFWYYREPEAEQKERVLQELRCRKLQLRFSDLDSYAEKFHLEKRDNADIQKTTDACRDICRKALNAREKKRFPESVEVGLNSTKGKYLDIFDNQYTLLTNMAHADTHPLPADQHQLEVPSLLLGSVMAGVGSPCAETIMLVLWLKDQNRCLEQQKNPEEPGPWIPMPGGMDTFGLYGDRRIASREFLPTVEKNQLRLTGRLVEFLKVGGVAYARLTPYAKSVLSGQKELFPNAMFLSCLLRKQLDKHKIGPLSLNLDCENEIFGEKNGMLYVPLAVWEKIKEDQSSWLKTYKKLPEQEQSQSQDAGPALYAELTETDGTVWHVECRGKAFSRWDCLPKKESEETLEIVKSYLAQPYLFPHWAPSSDAVPQYGAPSAKGNSAGLETQETGDPVLLKVLKRISTALQLPQNDENNTILQLNALRTAILNFGLMLHRNWIEDNSDKTLRQYVEYLSKFALKQLKGNAPYVILHSFLQKDVQKVTESVGDDQLILSMMKGDGMSADRYAEAVRRLVRDTALYLEKILNVECEWASSCIKGYQPCAITFKPARRLQNDSSATWWLTRAMRIALAYACQNGELTPSIPWVTNDLLQSFARDELLAEVKTSVSDGQLSSQNAENVQQPNEADYLCFMTWLNQKLCGSPWKNEPNAPVADPKAVERHQHAFQQFLPKLDDYCYSVELVPMFSSGTNAEKNTTPKLSLRVSTSKNRIQLIPQDILDWAHAPSSRRSWNDSPTQDQKSALENYLRQAYLDRQAKCLRDALKKKKSPSCSMDGTKQKLLLYALAAHLLQNGIITGEETKRISFTAPVYRYRKGINHSLTTKIKKKNREFTFAALADSLYSLNENALSKLLPPNKLSLKSKNLLGDKESITWVFTFQKSKEDEK